MFCLFVNSYAASIFNFDEEEFLIDMQWNKVLSLPEGSRPKVALVLGGGGARGFAHIGVFRVLEEEQIPIDLVVGTSIGSIAGAFYCAGISLDELESLAKNIKWGRVSNFTLPSIVSMVLTEKLLSNEEMEEFIRENLGEMQFRDLKIPLVCVATDLNTGETILLREGSVAFAIRASATIPGFFKPVEFRQRYLVDGGLSENIPVGIAELFDPDIIIAVAVSADITKNNPTTVFGTLMQAIYIQGSVLDQENISSADVVIRPAVGEISAGDLKQGYETISKGFIAAKNSLKDIKVAIINKTLEQYLIE